MNDALTFRTGVVSDAGRVRKHNEDSVLARAEIGLWAVADGMGGHGGGDLASQAVVSALARLAPQSTGAALLSEFEACIGAVNADLRALARSRGRGVVGTTLVAVLVHSGHFACVWCGDSRVYLLRNGALEQVTRDHSEVQELVDRGVLDRDEAKVWPRRNVVTRALGVAEQAELEIIDGPTFAGDRFLLCSDGLTAHVDDGEIAALLAAEDPQKACDDLLALTLQRGASDNVSLIVVVCGLNPGTVRSDGPWIREAPPGSA
jgi:serine/threonine protein phosphatase PrpC